MPTPIVVPELGESIVEARVARWLKREGDPVEVGEPLVELETDKIDVEVGATRTGVLARIERREGEDVRIGDVLGVVDETAEARPTRGGTAVASGERAPVRAGLEPGAAAGVAPAPPSSERRSVRATPSARRLARDAGVDLGTVEAAAAGGRVTRDIVQAAARAEAPTGTAAPAVAEPAPELPSGPSPPAVGARPAPARPGERARLEERVRLSRRRLAIARRLLEAQQTAAMLTTFNEIDMSAVQALRRRYKDAFRERYGVALGITAFFVKAVCAALREFPRLNAEIQGEEMVLKHYYDIGIAVGASEGLVVPVLRDADRMSFPEIERAIKDFARRAEDGTLTLNDLRGGTFTITNGGIYGSLLSTPILNPPQVGILGLHKIEDRAVPWEGAVVIRPMMYVALTYDHRIVDGREAVQFLVRIKQLVEDPASLLLEI